MRERGASRRRAGGGGGSERLVGGGWGAGGGGGGRGGGGGGGGGGDADATLVENALLVLHHEPHLIIERSVCEVLDVHRLRECCNAPT